MGYPLSHPVPPPYHYKGQRSAISGKENSKNVGNKSPGRLRWRNLESHLSDVTTKNTLNQDLNGWLTIPEVCARLSISYDTWAKWRQRQVAPQVVRLPNGQLRTREDWLQSFMDDLTEAS